MQTISQSFSLLWDALFLDSRAYATMRDNESPVKKGLIILIILGLVVAVAGIIGTTLEWASSPSLNAIKDTIYEMYQRAPWWEQMAAEPQALEMFQQIWDQVWQIVGFVIPSPASSLAGLVITPLSLILSWLIFGLIAHLFARMLGGTGSLSQTLGTTSLAAAPQLLLLLTVLPFVVVAGITIWTLLCRYMAIRVTHELSWARTMWSVILTNIALLILAGIFGGFAGVVAGAFFAGGM